MPRKKRVKETPEFEEEVLDDDEEVYDEVPLDEPEKQIPKTSKPQKLSSSRFAAFEIPKQIGIADTETKEIIGEGEHAILQTLAVILTKLENLENQFGKVE